jgi:hypothetical protein
MVLYGQSPLRACNHTLDFPVLWAVSDKTWLLRNMSYALRISSVECSTDNTLCHPLTTTSIAPDISVEFLLSCSTFLYSHIVHHLSLLQWVYRLSAMRIHWVYYSNRFLVTYNLHDTAYYRIHLACITLKHT